MRLLGWIIGAFMALTAPSLAAWPERPITAIVPFAAGGGTDGVARIWPITSGAILAKRW